MTKMSFRGLHGNIKNGTPITRKLSVKDYRDYGGCESLNIKKVDTCAIRTHAVKDHTLSRGTR